MEHLSFDVLPPSLRSASWKCAAEREDDEGSGRGEVAAAATAAEVGWGMPPVAAAEIGHDLPRRAEHKWRGREGATLVAFQIGSGVTTAEAAAAAARPPAVGGMENWREGERDGREKKNVEGEGFWSASATCWVLDWTDHGQH